MPHQRVRFAIPAVKKLAALWPVVGVIGPRQSGKTTLLQMALEQIPAASMDDLAVREEAQSSPQGFLAKRGTPLRLDEVQKAPNLFDAIKLSVDTKRIPGSYFLTGSSTFSDRIGVRESLTGRIGLLELSPMTLAELNQAERPTHSLGSPLRAEKPRFAPSEVIAAAARGGMPVPAFLRDDGQRDLYWKSWLDTTVLRDLARFFKRGFDPDLAFAILDKLGALLAEGELPMLRHFSQPAAKLRQYLTAMEQVFLLRRLRCHDSQGGPTRDAWILTDSGLAQHLMAGRAGEGATLSLVRHFLWNEWISESEVNLKRLPRVYFRSAKGSPVDLVHDGIPYRIVVSENDLARQQAWITRPLVGAMKALGAQQAYLIGPTNSVVTPQNDKGIGILPIGYWS